nr:MAG: hypothetical protein [Bacteriophage sp.]
MRGIELKHIGLRSFRLKGLTARWGIDGDRPPMPPALRTALVAWYNTEIQRATNFDVIESYAEDFTTSKWAAHPEHDEFTKTAKSIHITNVITRGFFLDTGVRKYGAEMVVKVSGLQPADGGLKYRYGSDDDTVQITQDGIYTLPAGMPGASIDGFNGFAATEAFGECDITIEQLPTSKLTDLSGNGHHLYLYGFTGSDNIVDNMLQHTGTQFGVSYGQPILTDYTVCSNRVNGAPMSSAFASKSSVVGAGAFILEYCQAAGGYFTYSFNTAADVTAYRPAGFMYQTSRNYNGTPIAKGSGADTDTLIVGAIRPNDTRTFHGGYKSFVLFNRTLTTEELAYVERWVA